MLGHSAGPCISTSSVRKDWQWGKGSSSLTSDRNFPLQVFPNSICEREQKFEHKNPSFLTFNKKKRAQTQEGNGSLQGWVSIYCTLDWHWQDAVGMCCCRLNTPPQKWASDSHLQALKALSGKLDSPFRKWGQDNWEIIRINLNIAVGKEQLHKHHKDVLANLSWP